MMQMRAGAQVSFNRGLDNSVINRAAAGRSYAQTRFLRTLFETFSRLFVYMFRKAGIE